MIPDESYANLLVFSISKCCYLSCILEPLPTLYFSLYFLSVFEVVAREGAGTGVSSSPRKEDTEETGKI